MAASRNPVREMISVQDAREEILRTCRVKGVESVPLDHSVGRTLREHVVADLDIPPFDNSAMDGFAVSLSDFEGESAVLTIHEDIPAGSFPSKRVGDGRCSRIMTGAPVPEGTDAVAPVEWCESIGDLGETVTITRCPDPGQHVRRRGSDIKRGDQALRAPMLLSPLTVGVLATLGYGEVPVSERPTLSVVATGDELVDASQTPTGGQIRNSNGPTLVALARAVGGLVQGPYVARDDYTHTRNTLEKALDADVLVISGGVSVGTHDFVKDVLDEMGIERKFWRVRQRPGKPLAFGTVDDKLVFGLPGNPVSTAVCFLQYVAPAVRCMSGLSPGPVFMKAALTETIDKVPSLHYFVPGRAFVDEDGCLTVGRSGTFGSHIFSAMAAANCLISLPEGAQSAPAGSLVEVELFEPPVASA